MRSMEQRRSWVFGSPILAGLGHVMDQCVRPDVSVSIQFLSQHFWFIYFSFCQLIFTYLHADSLMT